MSADPVSMAPPPSDVELVRRVREGDAQALTLLVRRHNRKLYRTARAILRDDVEAEDAVQDAYIRALRGLDAFRGDAAFSTWLVRIAANEALMRLRRRARYAVVALEGETDAAWAEGLPDAAPGPEGLAMNAEARRLLEQAIDALPDLYRGVFVMRAVEEMSVGETAAALDLPEATVRTRFFRARALMRETLGSAGDVDPRAAFAFDGERCERMVARVLAAFDLRHTGPRGDC